MSRRWLCNRLYVSQELAMRARRGYLALILLTLSIAAIAEGAKLRPSHVGSDAEAGRESAISLCSGCHAVSEDQPFALTDPPDFLTIANRPHVTADSLRHKIAMLPHTSLPGRMPKPMLNSEELANIVAYIMTTRER